MNANSPPLDNFPGALPASMDFNTMLAEAIDYCQKTSGDTWTDYNEHDPGLTILEQLCYALSDLGLRGQYNVADLLAGDKGRLDRDTLFTGDTILCSAPLTANDYGKLLYDRITGLKNFWLEPVADFPGLYRGLIERYRWGVKSQLLEQATKLLRANRTLCEDIVELKVLDQRPLALGGVLEIADTNDADEVMGAVLFDLDVKLVGAPKPISIDTQIAAGMPLEEIYEGPSLSYAMIPDATLSTRPGIITLQQIAGIVRAVDGVQLLRGLRFLDGKSILTLDADEVPFIEIPTQDGTWPFDVVDASGQPITLDAQRVMQFYYKCKFELKSRETAVRRSTESLKYRHLPTGRKLDIQRYDSIRHQFPVTYGLSHDGIPDYFNWQAAGADAPFSQPLSGTVGARRTAQVKQLRAYLLLFEQVLSNAFAQLANARRLFALRPPHEHSYFYQSLLDHPQTHRPDPLGTHTLLRNLSVEPENPRWRYVVSLVRQDKRAYGRMALCSDRVLELQQAYSLLDAIARQSTQPDNYRIRPEQGEILMALVDAKGVALAHGETRYRTEEQAQQDILALATMMQQAAAQGQLDRHLSIRRQGALGMHVTRHPGECVLSAYWPGTLDERDEQVTELLHHGADLRHYRYRQDSRGAWRFGVYNGRGRQIATSRLRAETLEESINEARAVAHLITHIGQDARAYARHVQLLPDSHERRQYSAEESYLIHLQRLVAQFDPHLERRHDFLNHLLARFNERFDDALLQSFDPRPADDPAFQSELASCKSSFLMAYPKASARRACGFDYGLKIFKPLPFDSGLEHRLYSLLGIGGRQFFARYPRSRAPLTSSVPGFHFHREHLAGATQQEQPCFLFEASSPSLFADLLKYGTDLERYHIHERHTEADWALHFDFPGAARHPILADSDRQQLERYRDQLIAWLQADGGAGRHLFEGEGLYVLEHILLRPLATPLTQDDGFYAFRISVLLPDWPSRFQSEAFKLFAERLIRENCPAQIRVDCHWLNFKQMKQFETLYAAWAADKYQSVQLPGSDAGLLDQKSQALREFLEAPGPGPRASCC